MQKITLRLARDGLYYTWAEFECYYGSTAQYQWWRSHQELVIELAPQPAQPAPKQTLDRPPIRRARQESTLDSIEEDHQLQPAFENLVVFSPLSLRIMKKNCFNCDHSAPEPMMHVN